MTEITGDNSATSAAGATIGSTDLPSADSDLKTQVWSILDAAVARGEMAPSARTIRSMVNRNNSSVLRAVNAWHEERRARHQAIAAVGAPIVMKPTAPDTEASENVLAGIPQAVAAVLQTANEALTAVAQALVQVVPVMRDALADADKHAERRLGETLAAASAAAEATLAVERERFTAERALLRDAADARMAETARMVEDATGMIEELETREAGTLVRVAALEARIDAAVAEAAERQSCIDELRKELDDTRHQRDTARLEVAALTGRLEVSDGMHAELEARFNSWETDRRQEVDRLRAENDQQRDGLTEAHRQIAALAAQQAGAAGSLGTLVERLLAATPIASGTLDASRDADGLSASCAAERDGSAPAPAGPKSRPARQRPGTARGKQEARLPFGPDFGVAAPNVADVAGAVAGLVEPTVTPDGVTAVTDS